MKLEEAKERLIELSRISQEGAKLHPQDAEMFLTDKEALDTAISELHAMQNLLDEKNEELEHLQKENEDKKTYEFGLIVGTKREREYWKYKIREKIEEIKKKPNNPNQKVISTQIDASLITCLEDLLKEE